MPKYDIAFSLNKEVDIEADTYEQAEEKLKAKLKADGIDVENQYTLEVFDVNEG